MIKDFLKNNEENAVSFITIAIVIIAIIAIVIIFIFNINDKEETRINRISKVNYAEVVGQEYATMLPNILSIRNSDSLYEKMNESYVKKYNLTKDNIKSFLLENNMIGNDINVISYDSYSNDGVVVFRYYYKNYSNYRYVNVIETNPGIYTISFEQDLNNIDTTSRTYKGTLEGIDFELRLIEKNEESVRFVLNVANNSNNDVFIDFNDINTFSLINNDGTQYKVSGIVAEDIGDLHPKSTITRELFFSINSQDYKNCRGLQVLNIRINGENKALVIEF
jgi:hypothetical protein